MPTDKREPCECCRLGMTGAGTVGAKMTGRIDMAAANLGPDGQPNIRLDVCVSCGFCGSNPEGVLPETNARFRVEFEAMVTDLNDRMCSALSKLPGGLPLSILKGEQPAGLNTPEVIADAWPKNPYTDNGEGALKAAIEARSDIVPGSATVSISPGIPPDYWCPVCGEDCGMCPEECEAM